MDDYVIGQQFVDEWNRIRSKVDGASGAGIQNTPTSLTHSTIDDGASPIHHKDLVRIKITGPTADGGTGRYLAKCFFGNTNNMPDNLQESDLGSLTGSRVVEVWNIADITNGSSSLAANSYVLGNLAGFNKTTGNPVYECSVGGALPKGQYQYMVFQMVSQNQSGWDDVRASPPLPS